MTMPGPSRRSFLLVSFGALCGCASLVPADKEPPRLFVLSPKSTFRPDLPRVDWQLTVEIPIAEAGLSGTRIALMRNPFSLEYYARANWIDTAPVMVQRLIVESFEHTGKIVAVARQSVQLRADYSLLTEIREFQAEYSDNGPPKAHVRLNAKLIEMPQRVIVATLGADHLEPAKGRDIEAIVAAFDEALGKTLRRVVEWALTTVPPKKG